MPRCRPSASRVRSSGSAARASSSSRSSAGRPARPSRRLRSAAVTIMGSPTGRQPWDTTSAVATAAGRTTPTAPSLATSPSSTSRLPPGPRAAEAAPPTTRTGGSSWPSIATTSSIGSENGSASSTRTSPGPHVVADRPPRATPDAVRAAVTRYGPRAAPPAARAHRATAGSSSTSRAPPTTATPVAPTRTAGDEQGPHRRRDVADRLDVVRRAEQDRQVGARPDLLEEAAGHLAGGLDRIGVDRQGAGERHGVPGRQSPAGPGTSV